MPSSAVTGFRGAGADADAGVDGPDTQQGGLREVRPTPRHTHRRHVYGTQDTHTVHVPRVYTICA
eukprot:48272-Eustigmatos_ZCMA.PRE.1